MIKTKLSVFLFLASLLPALGQETASFEDLPLKPNSFWNGADGSGRFVSGGFTFYNDYSKEWGSWCGFAYSNKTDSVTPDWTNQFSAVTAGGVFKSSTYGVGYDYGTTRVKLNQAGSVTGMYITNSTYTYKTLLNGDAFTKKFGGASGNDPDYFRLRITGVNAKKDTTGAIVFYLADFRPADHRDDYIIRKWTWVDLSVLGNISEIRFSLESTDSGPWGMNTPAYFCIDDLNHRDMAPVVNRPIRDIIWSTGENSHITIPLDSVFLDPDNPENKGLFSIQAVTGDKVADVSLVQEKMSLEKTSDAVSILVKPENSGQQKVAILYTSNGKSVSDTFSIRVNSTSSVVKSVLSRYRVFPNPFRGSFTVGPVEPDSEIFVYNQKGDLMFRSGNLTGTTENVAALHDAPAGIYFITLKGAGTLQKISIIKQ